MEINEPGYTQSAEISNDELMIMNEKEKKITEAIKTILKELGEDVNREELKKTPMRFTKALMYYTSGYKIDIKEMINNAIFREDFDDIILIKNIDFHSLCEHHLVPFYGQVHIAYQPDKHILGLSKFGRIVDVFARRIQIQERITKQIADALDDILSPKGVAVFVEAKHVCMTSRGVQKTDSKTVTNCFKGCFKLNNDKKKELSDLMKFQ